MRVIPCWSLSVTSLPFHLTQVLSSAQVELVYPLLRWCGVTCSLSLSLSLCVCVCARALVSSTPGYTATREAASRISHHRVMTVISVTPSSPHSRACARETYSTKLSTMRMSICGERSTLLVLQDQETVEKETYTRACRTLTAPSRAACRRTHRAAHRVVALRPYHPTHPLRPPRGCLRSHAPGVCG